MSEQPKILVVEDNANQLLLYQAELEREGYQVATATNGHEAVEIMANDKDQSIDLVVMDISMPGMDGIEAMNRITTERNKLPVILYSGYTSYKDNFLSWSADAYLVKSSDLTELKQTIKKLLKRGEGEKQEEPAATLDDKAN
jgi:CheY-like chemotaxis protein